VKAIRFIYFRHQKRDERSSALSRPVPLTIKGAWTVSSDTDTYNAESILGQMNPTAGVYYK